jgi:tetratricopeptide (TPR) repeat protein
LLQANPQSREAQSDVAINHRRVAETLFELGDSQQALAEASQSVTALERLSAGGDAYLSNYYASSLAALARIQSQSNPPVAIATLRKAVAIDARLIAADPSNSLLRSSLARCERSLADLYAQTGTAAEAAASCRSAIENWQKLKQTSPLKGEDAAGFAHCQSVYIKNFKPN